MKIFLSLLLVSSTVFAQVNYNFNILKDINSSTKDANIKSVQNVGHKAVISQIERDIDTGRTRLRLWQNDGTTMENYASSEKFSFYAGIYPPTVINDYHFFYVDNNGFESGLWVSKLGSSEIKQIAYLSYNAEIVSYKSNIYYGGEAQLKEGKLYRYNEDTNQSIEIKSNDPAQPFHDPRNLTVVNDKLFFTAILETPTTYRRMLWVSDGTTNGTHVINSVSWIIKKMSKIGKKVIYDCFNGTGSWFYTSDGTDEGTVAFKEMDPRSTFEDMYGVGDKAFLLMNTPTGHQLWVTDGTSENTKFVDYYNCVGIVDNKEIASKDGFIFYANGESKLAKTNGDTTVKLGSLGITYNNSNNFKMVCDSTDSSFYFSFGSKFYKTDGTAIGTQLISDKLRYLDYYHTPFAYVSKKIIAYAVPKNNTFGKELYEITGDTVKIVMDLDSTTNSSDVTFLLNRQGKTYFLAKEDNAESPRTIFETDGTAEGTRSMAIGYVPSYYQFIALRGSLYWLNFNRPDFNTITTYLYKIDFDRKDLKIIQAFENCSTSDIKPVTFQDKMYFIVYDKKGQRQLWSSNGTDTGTRMLYSFNESVTVLKITESAEHLYIFTKESNTISVWYLLNENTPLTLLTTVNSGYLISVYPNFRNKLAFMVELSDRKQLWVADGPSNSGTLINEFGLGINIENSFYFTDTHYYYSWYDYTSGMKIWRSDGTPGGTSLLLNIQDAYNRTVSICSCNGSVFLGLSRSSGPLKSFIYKHTVASNQTDFLKTAGNIYVLNEAYGGGFICLDNYLYYAGRSESQSDRLALFTSDGTSWGTKEIITIDNRANTSTGNPGGFFYPLNSNEMLITVNDKFYDYELFNFRRCEDRTVLSGVSAESYIQSSPTTINSTEKLTAESHVYYFAPQHIVLNPGFSVDNSGVFKAEIKDRICTVR